VNDCLACTEAKWYCSNRSVTLVLYRLGDEGGGCGEGIPVDASNIECVVPIMQKKKSRERERQVP
jgi:hypothetical protein